MKTQTPEGWVIIKVDEGKDGIWYRVFSTWRGSYLHGDRWRLSSGSQNAPYEDETNILTWKQASGTVYKLDKSGINGTTFYTHGVVREIIEKIAVTGYEVRIVNILDDSLNLLPMAQWQ